MKPGLRRVLIWAAYGFGYLFVLVACAYLTFPYDRLKQRIVSEYNAHQTGPNPGRLEFDHLSSYWLTGLEAEGVRLVAEGPGESPSEPAASESDADSAPEPTKKAKKPHVVSIDSAYARLSILNLLLFRKVINFGADAFGGSVSGQVLDSDTERKVEVEIEDMDVGQLPLVADTLGVPSSGKLGGSIELITPEARLSKGEGTMKLKIGGVAVGDGKAKIADTIALPRLEAGDLELEAEVKAGTAKITKFAATGPDLEFNAEGTIRLRDQPEQSTLSLNVRFKFTDRFANKNELTKALLGSNGLFDLNPKNKRAKQADGFYGWRVSGTLGKPSFTPAPTSESGAKPRHKR